MTQLDKLKKTSNLYSCEINAIESLFEVERYSADRPRHHEEKKIIEINLRLLSQENFESASNSFYLWLNQSALSLEIFRNETNTCAIVEILRACGGDRVEFVRNTRDGDYVEMNFYSEKSNIVERIYAPNVCALIDEMVFA